MKAVSLIGVLALLGLGALWMSLGARETGAHMFRISEAYARPLNDGSLAAVLTIANDGRPDRLISVSSPLGKTHLYSPAASDGVPVQSGISALALDAAHIQITPDKGELEDGALLPMTLTFAQAGTVSVKARLSDPAERGGASDVGLFGIGDICIVGEGEPAPAIELAVVADGDGWKVRVLSNEFEFSSEFLGLYHIPGMGHGHLYIGGMKQGRMLNAEARIGPLPKGTHEVRVTLNTNDHRAYVVDDIPVTAIAMISVD